MNKIHLCIDALAADVSDKLSQEADITVAEALQAFIKTKTYALLFDESSLLYLESAEYIYDMLQAEQRKDWEHWTEV
jgi:predicted P-loop ATPase